MRTGTDGSSGRVAEGHALDDSDRELSVVLSYLIGRKLPTAEIVSALGLSRSAYYLQRDEGRLITADNLLRLAAALDINPVDLLVRYGLVSRDAVTEYLSSAGSAPATSARPARKPRLQPRLDLPPL
jgi:DNA-binding Xre family transcriptional regulator